MEYLPPRTAPTLPASVLHVRRTPQISTPQIQFEPRNAVFDDVFSRHERMGPAEIAARSAIARARTIRVRLSNRITGCTAAFSRSGVVMCGLQSEEGSP
jgi:hypothetical protein